MKLLVIAFKYYSLSSSIQLKITKNVILWASFLKLHKSIIFPNLKKHTLTTISFRLISTFQLVSAQSSYKEKTVQTTFVQNLIMFFFLKGKDQKKKILKEDSTARNYSKSSFPKVCMLKKGKYLTNPLPPPLHTF